MSLRAFNLLRSLVRYRVEHENFVRYINTLLTTTLFTFQKENTSPLYIHRPEKDF